MSKFVFTDKFQGKSDKNGKNQFLLRYSNINSNIFSKFSILMNLAQTRKHWPQGFLMSSSDTNDFQETIKFNFIFVYCGKLTFTYFIVVWRSASGVHPPTQAALNDFSIFSPYFFLKMHGCPQVHMVTLWLGIHGGSAGVAPQTLKNLSILRKIL